MSAPMNRRGLMAGITAAAVTGPAMAIGATTAARPDAELLAACAAFEALERQRAGLHYGPGRIDDDDEMEAAAEPIVDAQRAILADLTRLRATTLAGFLARARTALIEDEMVDPEQMLASGYINEALQGALWRDLAEANGLISDARNRARVAFGLPPYEPRTAAGEAVAEAVPDEPPARSYKDPDAVLIAICKEHVENVRAYNADPTPMEEDESNPRWQAWTRTQKAIDETPALSLFGVLAKAKAAVAEGSEEGGPDVQWSQDIVRDLARLIEVPV